MARPKIEVAPKRQLVAAGSVAAAVVLMAGIAIGVGNLRSSDAAGPVTAPRPATLSTLVETDWKAGSVGDCLVQVPDEGQLELVACDQPHDLQRFATGTVSDVRAADDGCDQAFESFVGRPVAESKLDIAQTRPSDESWAQGDRTYQCYLGVEGQRLQGDARATGW